MNIEKIRSALEFARTRTPAGGPVSSQAEAGLMAIAEVEREMAEARALIERAWATTEGWPKLNAELRAFLEPVTPGEVAYTFGDAPNPPDKLPPAVCMKCGDDRNQPSKFCDHGRVAPQPAECRCACRKALERLQPWMNAINHVHLPDGSIQYASEIWDALATPCDCAGLREELVVALRNAAPALLDEIERLRKVEAAARAVAACGWGTAVLTEGEHYARMSKMDTLRKALGEAR